MTKINRPIAPSAPKKTVTTSKLRDIPTPPKEKPYKLGKGQDLLLGLRPSFTTNNIKNWGRSIGQLENGKDGLFSTNRDQYTEVTYDANNDEANNVVLGNTGNNIKDTTTRIVLDGNDTLQMSGTNTVSSVQSNNDGTVTVTFEEVVENPNENSQAPNQMSKWESATHTSIVTMPEESLEKITANLSSEQKEALGTNDTSTLAQRLGKKNQDDYTGTRDKYYWGTRTSSKKDKTENNGYYNKNDTNQDGVLSIGGEASTRNNKTLNLDDTDAEGNDTGKDVAQSLKIKKLDDSVTKALRLNINLGNKDTIEQLGGTEFVGSESTVGSNSMTLTLEQKNTNGGSRLIKITLPKDNLEKAIENLDPKLKDAILAKGETSQEDPPRRRTQEERTRREQRRNQSEEITFGKPTKIPSLDKKTPTYRPGPSSLQLPEFSASDAKASPFFKP